MRNSVLHIVIETELLSSHCPSNQQNFSTHSSNLHNFHKKHTHVFIRVTGLVS